MTYAEGYKRLEQMRKEFLPQVGSVMKEHRFEVFAAIDRIYEILNAACFKGLSGLEKERKKIMEGDAELDKILLDGLDEDLMLELRNIHAMFVYYDKCERILWQDFIFYIYIRGVMMMEVGIKPAFAVVMLLSLLPEEDSHAMKKVMEKRGVKIY